MNLPNAFTVGRIVATPLIAILPLANSWGLRLTAFILFLAAAISDYIDGYLARSRKQETDLGRLLEVVQGQDEPRLVDHDDEGIVFPARYAAEAEVRLEKISRLRYIGDGEIEVVQSHVILHFLTVASRDMRSKAIASTVGLWQNITRTSR